MITVAGGDSIVWGSELHDCLHCGPHGYSHRTFSALLAMEVGEYTCAAYPGYSNFEISQNLITTLKNCQTTPFVIVSWTWPSRDSLYTSESSIAAVEQYCNEYQIPYMFTCVDNCLFDVININNQNLKNWYLFPSAEEEYNTQTPRGFYQWAVENKYKVGPDHHPLEDAHLDAAKLMKDKFNELVKKINQ